MKSSIFRRLAIGMMVAAQILIGCSKDSTEPTPEPEPTPQPQPEPQPEPTPQPFTPNINQEAAQHGYMVLKRENTEGKWNFSMIINEADTANFWIDFNNNGQKDTGEKLEEFIFEDGIYYIMDIPVQKQVITVYGKIVSFSCSNNALSSLEVSNNKSLSNLSCSSNNFDQSAMEKLIASLPDTQGKFYGWWDKTETNYKGKELIDKIVEKGWTPYHLSENKKWEIWRNVTINQEAAQHGYMLLTTKQKVGTAITIYVEATKANKDNLWIDLNNDGVKDANENMEIKKYIQYTLGAQHITIYGKINHFSCVESYLTALDVSQNRNLQLLRVNNNLLTTLDVSKNKYLFQLECAGNKLTNLDISNNKKMVDIKISNMPNLTLNTNPDIHLHHLDCSGNSYDKAAMEKLIDLLPNREKMSYKGRFHGWLEKGDTNYKGDELKKLLKAKNWLPMHKTEKNGWVDWQ